MKHLELKTLDFRICIPFHQKNASNHCFSQRFTSSRIWGNCCESKADPLLILKDPGLLKSTIVKSQNIAQGFSLLLNYIISYFWLKLRKAYRNQLHIDNTVKCTKIQRALVCSKFSILIPIADRQLYPTKYLKHQLNLCLHIVPVMNLFAQKKVYNILTKTCKQTFTSF